MKECVATRGLVVGNEAYMSAVPILKGFSLVLVLLGDTVLVVLNDVDAGDAAIFMAQHHILLVHHLDDVLVCIHHTAGKGGGSGLLLGALPVVALLHLIGDYG